MLLLLIRQRKNSDPVRLSAQNLQNSSTIQTQLPHQNAIKPRLAFSPEVAGTARAKLFQNDNPPTVSMNGQDQPSSSYSVSFSHLTRSIRRETTYLTDAKQDGAFRVLIVDDDLIAKKFSSPERALKRHASRFEVYHDYVDGLKSIKAAPPDVVFLGDSINDVSGLTWLRKFNLAAPKVPIVLVSRSITPQAVMRAIHSGARGYLMKPLNRRKLTDAIERCLEGWPILCRQAQGALFQALRPHGGVNRLRLTAREEDVLMFLSRKLSNKEIASALAVGTGTVHSYLTHIYRKLGAHTRREAVAKFFRQLPSTDESLCE